MTVLIVAVAIIIAALLGWPITALILKLARNVETPSRIPAAPANADQTGADQDNADQADTDQQQGTTSARVLRGGLTIGMLERIAVVLCIVFDQPMAIAYVVAVKGLGRYPELKETPAASERFIIGTLASLIWAALVGIVAKWLLLGLL